MDFLGGIFQSIGIRNDTNQSLTVSTLCRMTRQFTPMYKIKWPSGSPAPTRPTEAKVRAAVVVVGGPL